MALNENDEILNNLLKSKQVEIPDYNPNDEILNDMASAKKQNLQGSVYVATQKDPDRYAQVLDLSKKSNLPAEIVERNYDELSKKHDSEKFDFDNLVKNSPTLSSWMEDTNNSSVAHDDVDNLSKLEQHVNDHNTLSTLYNSFNSGLAQMWASVARTPGYLVNAAMIVPNLGVEAVYPGQPEMQHKAPDWLINNPIAKYYDQQAEAFKTPEMGADVIEEVKKGNYSRAGNAMLAQAASNAPNMLMMILGAASGMPTAALGFAGVTTAAGANAESMNQEGVSPLQSAISATTKGTIEAGFESLGTFGLFSHWEKTLAQTFGKEISKKTMKEFSKSLMYSMAGEANEEFLTSAAQDFTDYVTGVNPNALTDMWQRAGNAGIAGAFTGGTMTAGGGAIVAGVKGQEMRRTAMAKDFYLSMGNTAEATKLRQRLPEAQRNLVEKITEGTDVKDIFVSTEALEEYFQSKNLDPASVMQETGTLEAYNEAKLVGSDVKIPLATWAHNFVGTEHYQGLANDIKFNPSDYSFNEIQKINAETKTKMETIEKENPVPVEDPKVASAKIVSEQITSQLKEAGFSEDIASTYSQLYGDVFGNLGEREGIDPLELFNKFGLSISRPELNGNQTQPGEQVASQEQVFNQEAISKVEGQGYKLEYKKNKINDDRTEHIVIAFDSEGNAVGKSIFREEDGQLKPHPTETVKVDKEHQRKGIANAMYQMIESKTGQIISPSESQTQAAKGLWAQQNRPFGNQPAAPSLVDINSQLQNRIEIPENISVKNLEQDSSFENLSNKEIRKKTFDSFKNKKSGSSVINTHTGESVQLSKEGLKKSANMAMRPEQAIALKNIASIIKDAVFLREESNRNNKSSKINFEYLYSPIKIGEKSYVAKITVTNNQGEGRGSGRKFYALHVQEVAPMDLGQAIGLAENTTSRPTDATVSKAYLLGAVNEARQTTELFQNENDPRGRIRFGANGINIELLQKADLSTFLHETGHFYLNVLGELSSMENASEQTKKDYKTILDWFGVQSKEEITVDHHEQFARGFEAYLFEGKAPSSKLREAFTRFRAWLLQVYKSVAKLNVNLTPEVKNVFDRLVASDEEIKQAQYDQGTRPLFEDPKALGMSEAQANKYKSAIEDARLQAEEELTTKLMANVQKERESLYREERSKVREEVEQDVSLRKEYITLEALQGKEFMEGVPMSKLSKQAIIDDFGEEVLKKLPRPYCYSVEDGIHPDVAAEMFGYTSGQELLETLTKMLPKDQVIDKITDDIMRDKHGDLLNDPHLGIEALKAVHNEKKAQLLRLELQYLAEGNFPAFKGLVRKITKKIPTNQAIKAQAADIIKKKTYRDISPIVYQRAERKAATESVQAFLRGDIEAAFNAKEKELMNHELYKAAVDAVEVTDKFAIYALKFSRKEVRQRIGKAGQVYLDQIDALMERFDFKKAVSGKALDKRKKFRDWYNDEVKAGNTPIVPEKLLDESFKQSYKEVSYEDLLGIKDAIKNIEHFARLKNELIAGVNARAFDEVKAELVDTIYAHHKISTEKYDYSPGIKDKIITYAKGFLAAHTRMEFMFEFLDGNKSNGAFWNNFFRPLALAEDAKSEMMRGLIKGENGLEAIMNAYTDKERASWFYKKKFIKEINNSINKGTALAIALNWGNEYNREALLAGESWSEAQALAVMDQMLDAKDWKTVQAIWDLIDTLWPHVAKLESEVTGIIPAKVESAEVINKHGVFKGGYYPIIFDAKRSFRTEQLQAATDVSELFGNNIARSMTRHGHTNERSNTGSKPLKLELTGLTEHLSNVVHDLTHRKAVIDVGRLLFDKEIQEAIEGAVGREGYRQLKPWINSIANDRNTEPANMVFAALSRARTGATVVNLGLKTTSALAQVLGYFNTIDQLGIKYAMMGLSQTLSKPRSMAETWDFIASRSVMMKDRTTTFDRDVKDATRKLYIAPTTSGLPALIDPYTRHLHETYFYLTGLMDLGTAVPTWIGAYNKAMDGAEEGIQKGDEKKAAEYADKVVRQTQSAGSVKDLAGVQTGNELQKLFTMFYSQVSLQFNLLNKAKNQYKFDDDLKKLIGSLFLLWFLPATLEDLIKGRGPSGDDDPEKILKEEAKNLITYPFKTVVLLRDIMSGMEFGGYNPSPAFDAMESLGKSATLGVELVTGNKKEVTRTDVKNLFNTTGYFAGYPAKQMWQSSEYFYDWMTGRERPQNPVEGIARTLVYGKKKK